MVIISIFADAELVTPATLDQLMEHKIYQKVVQKQEKELDALRKKQEKVRRDTRVPCILFIQCHRVTMFAKA